MGLLVRGNARVLATALAQNSARHARLASRFGHQRSQSALVRAAGTNPIVGRGMGTNPSRGRSDLAHGLVPTVSDPAVGLSRTVSDPAAGLSSTVSDPAAGLSPPVAAQLRAHIAASGSADAFYVVDTSAVTRQFELWTARLPRVRPFYAVKCNPDAHLVRSLAQLGVGFDCASQNEIRAVLGRGVRADDIIYANPCKQSSHVAFAAQHGVDLMTFDSVDEAAKIRALHPRARLVLRIYVDDSKAVCRLGTKFGAMLHDAREILRETQRMGGDVVGVSFHVGSGCLDVSAYADAVARARKVFDMGADLGMTFSLLDVGGGFPGTDAGPIRFDDCAAALDSALNEHFPEHTGVRVISEPGRFFAASTHTLAVNVIGRKPAPTFDVGPQAGLDLGVGAGVGNESAVPNYMYFVNDGLYGSFNCVVYDHPMLHPVVLSEVPDAAQSGSQQQPMPQVRPRYPASLWGPTCDGMDCIMKQVALPPLDIGQWLAFPAMGAYTCAAGSDFNGFAPPSKIYFDAADHLALEQQQFVH